MTTLYVRDVPDDVAATLRTRAAEAGQSLSAYVAAQLVTLASRPTNADVVARLRGRERSELLTDERIVAAVEASRR